MIVEKETPKIREAIGKLAKDRPAFFQFRETTELLKLFFERSIPVIPLKGQILSKRLYGNIRTRGISADIDLLIEEKNKEIARKVLEGAGYFFQDNSSERRLGQCNFAKPGKTAIDLHWELSPTASNTERIRGFWQGVRLQEENGVFYYEFKEEELLLHLSVHLVDSVHLIDLRYISDINMLLTKYRNTLDWESIIKKARSWKLPNSLYTTLKLSRTLFGSYVPDGVLTELKPHFIKRMFIDMFANKKVVLNMNSKRRHFIEGFLKYLLFQILEAESLKDYFAIVFPPKRKMGSKTYLQRLAAGLLKLAGCLK